MTRTTSLFLDGPEASSQRARMLDAITRAVADKGYARVTVADIVAAAGVSRRTFYEQFEDKEDCLLAAATEGTTAVLTQIAESAQDIGPDASWTDVLAAGIDAYVSNLAANPHFTRTFLVDIPGTSPRAIQLRRDLRDRFVELYRFVAQRATAEEPGLGEVPEIYLRALVGATAELIHQHVLTSDPERLDELAPVIIDLASLVIRGAKEAELPLRSSGGG
jgi:AcrR family transcriptional regulator